MLKENIDILKDNGLHYIIEDFNNIESFQYPKFISKRYSRETFQLEDNSLYNTKVEIDKAVEISNFKKEVLFVFGINAIEEILWIIKNKHPESIVIIIELNPSFFSYTLHNKNLKEIFEINNVVLFVGNHIAQLNIFLQNIFYEFNNLKYLKNINVYVTHFYRQNQLNVVKEFIENIRKVIATLLFSLGNDLEDNLIGLERNLSNIEYISQSIDLLMTKNIFKGIPAVIVAAGPSLNKNIQQLKGMKDKVVIIAVDTIVGKLLAENIEPHFVCSIERVPEVYEYFYKDLELPKETIIVGPPVLDSRVFEKKQEDILIPFREGISETNWLQKLLDLPSETAISMGYSCANIAFSIGCYLGCEPIILVGQDLAYGENESETHASGTKYDEFNEKSENQANFEWTAGYYGGNVKTTKIWLQFKHWLENEINTLGTTVIDATEGGAKINFAQQISLARTKEVHCQNDIPNIYNTLKKLPHYNINRGQYFTNLKSEIKLYTTIKEKSVQYKKILDKKKIRSNPFQIKKLCDDFQLFVHGVVSQPLLLHNLQSVVLQYYWSYNGRLQVFNEEFFLEEINEQQKLLTTIIEVLNKILVILIKHSKTENY